MEGHTPLRNFACRIFPASRQTIAVGIFLTTLMLAACMAVGTLAHISARAVLDALNRDVLIARFDEAREVDEFAGVAAVRKILFKPEFLPIDARLTETIPGMVQKKTAEAISNASFLLPEAPRHAHWIETIKSRTGATEWLSGRLDSKHQLALGVSRDLSNRFLKGLDRMILKVALIFFSIALAGMFVLTQILSSSKDAKS